MPDIDDSVDTGTNPDGPGAEPENLHRVGPLDYSHSIPPNAPVGRLDLAVLVLRGLAVWCLVAALPVFLIIPAALSGSPGWATAAGTLLPLVVYLLMSAILWFGATTIALWMFRDIPAVTSQSAPRSFTSGRTQAIGISLIGIGLIAYALRLFPDVIYYMQSTTADGIETDNSPYLRQTLLQLAIELAIGLWLFFGSRGLSGLWHKMRRA